MKFNVWLNQVNIEVDSGWGRGHPANCPVELGTHALFMSRHPCHDTTASSWQQKLPPTQPCCGM